MKSGSYLYIVDYLLNTEYNEDVASLIIYLRTTYHCLKLATYQRNNSSNLVTSW